MSAYGRTQQLERLDDDEFPAELATWLDTDSGGGWSAVTDLPAYLYRADGYMEISGVSGDGYPIVGGYARDLEVAVEHWGDRQDTCIVSVDRLRAIARDIHGNEDRVPDDEWFEYQMMAGNTIVA
ncbi:hypothetical protein RYH80_18820 [Halobaculum sp. MBLA0147]|uniref:hypothetical protein n=1 Tax=Halobaculum sp. MBLA0147 TaxID=3079934 RepID=UPI0035254FC8